LFGKLAKLKRTLAINFTTPKTHGNVVEELFALVDGCEVGDFYLFRNGSCNRNDTTFAVFVRKEIIRGCGAEFFGECLIRNDF
jgi:hypothetical protein